MKTTLVLVLFSILVALSHQDRAPVTETTVYVAPTISPITPSPLTTDAFVSSGAISLSDLVATSLKRLAGDLTSFVDEAFSLSQYAGPASQQVLHIESSETLHLTSFIDGRPQDLSYFSQDEFDGVKSLSDYLNQYTSYFRDAEVADDSASSLSFSSVLIFVVSLLFFIH